MLLITPPTTPQRCNRGSRSSLALGGRINFQPFNLEQPAKAALSSLHSDGYRQVHPTSPSNFNTQPTSNPDSCWRRNPPVVASLSPTCTASAVSVRDFFTDRLAGHAGRIASPLSSLGFAGVPCPPSSSAIDRGSSFIRCRSFIRSPRTRWRLGVGAAASSRWAFWVPHTRRRVLVTSAGRSPFIRCASFTGNAHSRATSRSTRACVSSCSLFVQSGNDQELRKHLRRLEQIGHGLSLFQALTSCSLQFYQTLAWVAASAYRRNVHAIRKLPVQCHHLFHSLLSPSHQASCNDLVRILRERLSSLRMHGRGLWSIFSLLFYQSLTTHRQSNPYLKFGHHLHSRSTFSMPHLHYFWRIRPRSR